MSDPEWQIQIKRSGGFAGVSRGGEVRSGELSAEEAEELECLATGVDFAAAKERAAPGQPGEPDRFQYSLVVDRGSEHYELEIGEGSMDERMKELVQWLMPRATSSSGESAQPSVSESKDDH
jgi:Emfourin